MSTKSRTAGPREVLVAVGCLAFAGTTAWIATFPISVSVQPAHFAIGAARSAN